MPTTPGTPHPSRQQEEPLLSPLSTAGRLTDDTLVEIVHGHDTGVQQGFEHEEDQEYDFKDPHDVDDDVGDANENQRYATVKEEQEAGVPTLYRAVLATTPLFMGYAGTVMLQHVLKSRIGIKDGDNGDSYWFGMGVACVYVGNLLFRLLHNVFFSFMPPRFRVVVAYACIAFSQGLLGTAYWIFDSKSLVFVFIAYLVAGVGIGTFEANMMSCITPLGHGTKSWAVTGIPIGFNGVSIGFFTVFAIWPHRAYLEGGAYFFISGCNLLAIAFFLTCIPRVDFAASGDNAAKLVRDLQEWRTWLPLMWRHYAALFFTMLGVSLFTSISFYIYDKPEVPLWPYSTVTVPKNAFQTFFNCCTFLGDFTARRLAYRDRARNPLLFLVCTVVGAALVLSKTALIAPIGTFLVMFTNGSVYSHTMRHVDNHVPDRFNLFALSVWLFAGDIGSIIAAVTIAPIRAAIGPVPV